MQSRVLIVGALLSAVVACAIPPQVLAGTFTFQVSNGIWNRDDNWLDDSDPPQTGTPGPNDIAIIPVQKTCRVEQDTTVGEFRVKGELRICNFYTLTVKNDSTVDGLLLFHSCVDAGGGGAGACEFNEEAYLEIDDDLTIRGLGTIRGAHCRDFLIPGEIIGSGELTVEQTGDPPPDLTVVGEIDIEVALVNDADVGVDHADDTMQLSTNAKSGTVDGVWFVTDGLLIANAAISGAAHWSVTQSQSAHLRILTSSTNQTGTVTLHDGTFEVEANFCTQGSIHFEAPSENEATTIKVHNGKSAKFAGACP